MTRISDAEMADELDKLVYSKSQWLAGVENGNSKRPDWEVAIRKRERVVLEQAAGDYRRASRGVDA